MGFEVGQKVGGYEFLAVVEATSTGVAYRVHNTLADRVELLKVLPRDLQDDAERVERFLREAKIHARLHHPNIASFYNATRIEDQLVMTSEMVEGTSLEQYIGGGPLPLDKATKYFEQALAALSYAHREGVVHRDITPGHLIITPDDTVKVIGFGLAKKSSDPQLTQPGIVLGSVYYMSPEQIKGSTELDRRTDIYSLGVVLYEAITGKKPFDSKSQYEVFLAHVNNDPAPPSSVCGDIPAQLDQVVLTAMAKQPLSRFQTAEEFSDSLGRLGSVLQRPVVEAQTPAVAPLRPAVDAAAHAEPLARSEAWPPLADASAAPGRAVAEWSGPALSQRELSAAIETHIIETHIIETHIAEPPARPLPPGREEAVTSGGFAYTDPGQPVHIAAGRDFSREWDSHRSSDPIESERPAAEAELSTGEIPILLRPSGDLGAAGYFSAAARSGSAAGVDAQPEAWFGEQAFAGWTSKDLLAVGALTFVIVAAVFFVLLTFLNR